ncbi:hypothetical protein [Sphingomonas sp. PR090111-T3T-6A]|uniref:hypothetical protein n=1 Tax=Sphingomonas sp. PR090111-T3T-6A TaxID=685778 RepID=UPI0003797DFF|nr:hypothetical protein [Sphingomonas sp. PR090111-T3T-6A]
MLGPARPFIFAAFLLATPLGARRPPPPPPDLGTVTLDRMDPVVDATVAGVSAKLAVVLDQGVYLAPPFAEKVPLPWKPGGYEEVGRVRVPFRQAAGEVSIAGITTPRALSVHDGPCCRGHDGAIGAAELPWSVVRFGQEGGAGEQRFPAENDAQSGLSVPWRVGRSTVHIVLAPDAPETLATASAAAVLAGTYGGHFEGQARQAVIAFGVNRQVRDMVLSRAAMPLGLRLDRVAVRLADFEGSGKLPQEKADGGILVRHAPPAPQHGWPALILGRDLLGRCPVISVYRDEGAIGLVCKPA